MRRFLFSLALAGSLATVLSAHVGSPDIYLDAKAGPYQLFVTVRPPTVIPGVAELEVRSPAPGIAEVRAVPMPMAGPGARFAPLPDKLKVSPQDPQFFTGSLWMMAPGSWQVKITAKGREGDGSVAVPVPSAAIGTKKMEKGLGGLLLALMTFLVLGAVAIVGASVREAQLPAGVVPDRAHRNRGRIAMAVAFVLVIAVLVFGRLWWTSEATAYDHNIYKPLDMTAAVDKGGLLTLTLHDPGWLRPRVPNLSMPAVRSVDDLILDHDHLMHLYVLRQPGLDVVYHLHPELVEGGTFRLALPSMPAGDYKLYADIVHRSGFPETLVTSISLPATDGRALTGDDASGTTAPWTQAPAVSTEFALPDGYKMQWVNGNETLRAKQPELFRFRLVDSHNQAPSDMVLYMGMLGHAAFVKTDGTVFAHIHPTGSVSMAAFMKAQGAGSMSMPGMDHSSPDHAGMDHSSPDHAGMDHWGGEDKLPNEVSFPYGLPSAGRYRIVVQMKHGSTVETGIFDARVE